ncbi:MAG: 3'(2'),5'-bisphosphate nucleotidase CysQ [Rhodomicrobium sp.]|nr:3'(2'),5'-bisphosphate nucleotidase CysQ [Rhodomicrobium sp.]
MRNDLIQDFDLLREAAREAAGLALGFHGRSIIVERKPDGSAVTEADKAVDALLAARLKEARPDYGWLSEESADHVQRVATRRVWIVDPIDGTRAFVQGGSDWTIALCLAEEGIPVLSVVINPVRGEVYEAQAGMGATLNGRPICASGQNTLSGARVAVAATSSKKGWHAPWPGASPVAVNSTIYRMALIASAHADASFALKPKWEWDIAAGALLVTEAGGKITSLSGAPLKFNSPEAKVQGFLAAAPELHQKLTEQLNGTAKDALPARGV